ncbi:MAG TPA: Ig-like domain-containing protein, partial [Vicinamibacterales bacterium]|nr:Ig-like domain-containing protein [Vicinamibacterales bacterium]
MRQFARPLMVLALLCLGITGSRAQGTPAVFINEIHYDNTGADSGEFIEIAGPAGTNLAGYSLVLYNGAVAGAAVTYNTKALAGVIPNQLNGYGTISFAYPADGIQNGGNDAVALAQGASVLQFLSYEGVTTASNGPAAGMTSADIGVSENGTGAIGTSLRLTGAGSGYSDFVWAPTAAASPGLVNQGQTFGAPPDSAPAVIGTSPASGALNVPVDSTIAITFSESVNATPDAFAVSCGGPIAVSQTASPAATISLKPNSDLPFSTHCTVTVLAAKISDQDANDPPDQMAANYTFSFDTISAADDAPSVASVSPADGTTAVPVSSNIVVTFSEVVTATVHAFTVDCAGPRTFSQTGSASASFTIDPDVDLPYGTVCTVATNAAEIFDADTNDPPDSMAANMTFSFTTADPPPPVATNVMINELDSDQAGVDAGEFVELFDGGAGATPLDGLTLVLYNGSNDLSYAAFDLDGKKTDANGYFILGNAGVPGVGLVFPGNFLQNGQDAVALFVGNATDFPNGTAVTTLNLQDAVVYDKGEADDPGLLALLNPGEPQVNEAGGGNGTGDSIGRCPDGSGGQRNTSTYRAGAPSAGAVNVCPPPPPPPATSVIVISQIYGGGGSVDAAYQNDYVELYNRGTVTVDTTGWSLQYAAATGSGWDFNKTPLGGPIAPGEYYLVRLASNGANGAALPAANVSGPINMSASQGKIAIVDSFDALVGNCPIANPHLKDLVGYGGA